MNFKKGDRIKIIMGRNSGKFGVFIGYSHLLENVARVKIEIGLNGIEGFVPETYISLSEDSTPRNGHPLTKIFV